MAGDGEGGAPVGTDWQSAALDLGTLAAGQHTLTIGAYNSQKTQLNETTELLVDDVAVTGTVAGGGGGGGSTTVWLHKDHLGSIQAATDGDGAAALRRGYAPYGAQLWATAATFTEARNFIGERLDAETGLLYLHARYYDPVMGQFLSADPSDPLQPGVGVNRYAYAGGNPVAYADPYGLGYADRVADESVANATGPNGAPKKDWSRSAANKREELLSNQYACGPCVLALPAVGGVAGGVAVGDVILGVLGTGAAVLGLDWAWDKLFNERPEEEEAKPGTGEPGANAPSAASSETATPTQDDYAPAPGDPNPERNPAQDRELTNRDIKDLKAAGYDVHEVKGKKGASGGDLFKDKKGNVYEKPKGGYGYGEPTGINLNDL